MNGIRYFKPLVPLSHALRVGTAGQTRRNETAYGTERGTARAKRRIHAVLCGSVARHGPGRGPGQERPSCPTPHASLGTDRHSIKTTTRSARCSSSWRWRVGSKPCFRFAQTACPAGLKTAHGVRHGKA